MVSLKNVLLESSRTAPLLTIRQRKPKVLGTDLRPSGAVILCFFFRKSDAYFVASLVSRFWAYQLRACVSCDCYNSPENLGSLLFDKIALTSIAFLIMTSSVFIH